MIKFLSNFIDYKKLIERQSRQGEMKLQPEKSKKMTYSAQVKTKKFRIRRYNGSKEV